MQRLCVSARHHLRYPLDVPLRGLHQTAQIGSCLHVHVSGPEAKKKRKSLLKSQESRSQLLQESWGMASLLPTTVL
jgi:hypothetical protein